jgi:hypothetical protein
MPRAWRSRAATAVRSRIVPRASPYSSTPRRRSRSARRYARASGSTGTSRGSGTPIEMRYLISRGPPGHGGVAIARTSNPGRAAMPRPGDARAVRSGISGATTVPAAPRSTPQPCARSSSYAATTVLRLIPSSAASARVLGSRSPARSAPRRMSSLIAVARLDEHGTRSGDGPHEIAILALFCGPWLPHRGGMTAPTDRTLLHRKPARGSHDRAVIDAILDEALVCHVAFPAAAVHDAGAAPVVLPTTHVRVGDQLSLHGAAASRMLKTLAGGVEVCVAVTLLDGLVLARAAMHHSMNYRSVVLFGRARAVEDRTEKLAALAALIDHVVPRRSSACRPPNDKELAATLVIAVPIAEASAEIRSGPPLPDDAEDAALPYWAGVIPLYTHRGSPLNAPGCHVPAPAEYP